jgi:hypothetical protein
MRGDRIVDLAIGGIKYNYDKEDDRHGDRTTNRFEKLLITH